MESPERRQAADSRGNCRPSRYPVSRERHDHRAFMFGAPCDPPLTIGFLLVPNFPMMAFASAIEPLRSANRQSGTELYRWRLFSADGGAVAASNGIEVMPHFSIKGAEPIKAAVVCAGI